MCAYSSLLRRKDREIPEHVWVVIIGLINEHQDKEESFLCKHGSKLMRNEHKRVFLLPHACVCTHMHN